MSWFTKKKIMDSFEAIVRGATVAAVVGIVPVLATVWWLTGDMKNRVPQPGVNGVITMQVRNGEVDRSTILYTGSINQNGDMVMDRKPKRVATTPPAGPVFMMTVNPWYCWYFEGGDWVEREQNHAC